MHDLQAKITELEQALADYEKIGREHRQAREFSDKLLQTADAIVVTLDLNANITRFNDAAERLTGYSRSETIGANWIDLFIPEQERPLIHKVFLDVVRKGGEISANENPILTKSGEERIFSWSNTVMRGEDDSPTGVLSIGVDVTEKRRVEGMLRSVVASTSTATGKAYFRPLVKHLALGVGVRSAIIGELQESSDPVIRTLAFWDNGAHRPQITYSLSGTPCEEVIRKTRSFCYSDVRKQFPRGHVLIELGVHTYLGTPLITPGGETRGVLAIMHDGPFPDTMVPHIQSMMTVLASRTVAETERVRAESELLSAKEKLQLESQALSQKNVALKQILDHIENEREQFRDELSRKIETLLLPTVEKLRENEGHLSNRDVDHLEDALKSILGKEIDVFRRNLMKLSGRELEICEMIRDGLSSKEIADKIAISSETVSKHRESIREKLQIKNSSVNLSTYLKSRPWSG